ncbi:Uncharacterized protein DAT39_001714, partial [Clarias magur]
SQWEECQPMTSPRAERGSAGNAKQESVVIRNFGKAFTSKAARKQMRGYSSRLSDGLRGLGRDNGTSA